MPKNNTGQDMGDETTRTGMEDTPQQGEKGGQATREENPEYDPMADMDNDF